MSLAVNVIVKCLQLRNAFVVYSILVLGQLEITHIAGCSMLSRYHKTVFV